MLFGHRRFLIALALTLAACGGAAAGKASGDDTQASSDTAANDVGADAPVPADSVLPDAAVSDADASDAVFADSADSADSADTSADGGEDGAVDGAADATELADTASDGGDASPDVPDGAVVDADSGPVDAAVDAAEVCNGGLPDCPKNPNGPPGTPPPWLGSDCLAPMSPDWQEAGLKPTPDLGVELGPLESSNPWAPYTDGGWAALYHGPQGLVHTELAIRVTGVGTAGAQVTASVMRAAYLGCASKTSPMPFAVGLTQQPGGTYFSSNMGLLAVWDMGVNSWKYCGQWAELHVAVRLPDGRWGEGKVRVRLWDMVPSCPPP